MKGVGSTPEGMGPADGHSVAVVGRGLTPARATIGRLPLRYALVLAAGAAQPARLAWVAVGVPIATLARQMGHADINQTYATYGGWVTEMGADAAAMREIWQQTQAAATTVQPGTP